MYLWSLHVDDASRLLLQQVRDEAVLEGVGLSPHVVGIPAAGEGQEQTVLTLILGGEGTGGEGRGSSQRLPLTA